MISNISNLSLIYKKSDVFQKNIYINIGKMGLSDMDFGIYRGKVFSYSMNDF
jgi:hypothetical protein